MSHVHDFGAIGDGITDDTDALRHALEAGDGALVFGKGTYRITQPLVIDTTRSGYTAVRGEGGTTRLLMAGPGPALRILGDHRGTASPASFEPHTWQRERFPTVTGVEILGEHPEAVGIELRKTMQATISQVLIRNCRIGIQLVERNRNFLLSHAHLYDNAEYGLFFDRCNLHQAIVTGCHISYNKRAGIRSLDGDVHNLHITGCDIEYNNHPGVDASPNGEPTGAEIWFEAPDGIISEVTIASCTIQATIQPGGANIRIHGSEKDWPTGARLIAITGNVIGSQTRGIELRRAQRVTITGNTIYDSAEWSLFASQCSGMAVGSNTITWRAGRDAPARDGVRFEDCDNVALSGLVTEGLAAGNAERGAAITLLRSTDMSIDGCHVINPRVRGIELESCARCRVANNTVVDRRETPTMLHAIRVTGESRDNAVLHNLVGGAVGEPVDVPPEGATVAGSVRVG